MPIYEYRCEACGNIDEVMQKIDEPAPETCPACHASGSMHRLISRTAFVLKGTGWYETDFKDKKSGGNGHSYTTDSDNGNGAGEHGSNGNGSNGNGSGENGSAEKTAKSESKTSETPAAKSEDSKAKSSASAASSSSHA